MWLQREISLPPLERGIHIITGSVVSAIPELNDLRIGLLHLFIRHTSASLTINENASPEVRGDLERWLDDAVREDAPYWRHTLEGPDDMPAHVKTSLMGPSLTVPITEGRLGLGTWQGICLCEHRDRAGSRHLTLTASGEAY